MSDLMYTPVLPYLKTYKATLATFPKFAQCCARYGQGSSNVQMPIKS